MKGFSKFTFIVGIIFIFIGLVSVVARGTLEYSYFEFEEDLKAQGGYDDISDDELDMRYENYLESNERFAKGFTATIFFIGMGCVVGVLLAVALENHQIKTRSQAAEERPTQNEQRY
ncbi:MAG: hypothetical protein AB1Z23_03470 [Eubacteriales bacterium]